MKIIRWMMIIISILIVLYISGNVYIGLNGNPITKYYFKKEIQNYLVKIYPETQFTIHSIEYGFKEMNYFGDVSPKNNAKLHFLVERDYSGALYDTWFTISLEREVSDQCEVELKKYFSKSTCSTDIRLDSNQSIDMNLPFPKYMTLKKFITKDSKIRIEIHGKDNERIEDYQLELVNFKPKSDNPFPTVT